MAQVSAPDHRALLRILEARWLICKISTSTSEYDAEDKFRRIVEIASEVSYVKCTGEPRFVFETGFPLVLHFVAMKCNNLALRLSALALLKEKFRSEASWDSQVLYAIPERAVEDDYGIVLRTKGAQTEDFENLLNLQNMGQSTCSMARLLCPWIVLVTDICDRLRQSISCSY
jgi:hypothetical protein